MHDDDGANDTAADLISAGLGDLNALRRVYEATGGQLMALCLAITADRGAAEDVLQETFIKVWNRAAGYDPQVARPEAWLAAIARNSAIDWYRAHHRRSFLPHDDAINSIADSSEAADDRLLREEAENRAVTSLSDLPPELEADIRSIFFRGATYQELASERGLSVNTLKSRVRRGLIRLRGRFGND